MLLGASGCGKTTALRIIAGLETATSGSIMIGDRDVTNVLPKNRDVAMVFQSYALYPHKTVAENIGYPLKSAACRRPSATRRCATSPRRCSSERCSTAIRASSRAASASASRWRGRSCAGRRSS